MPGPEAGPSGPSPEQRLEYLPGLGKVLPALVLIGVKRGPGGQASISVGTEVETEARRVLVLDFDGKDLARADLEPASTRQGGFLMGRLELGALPRLFLVILEDGAGERIPELTIGVDTQSGMAFPAPLHDPSAAEVGAGQSLEPVGRTFPGVINVTRVVTDAAGVDLDVVLDDGGAGRVLLVTPLRRFRKKEDSRGEAPRPGTPMGPGGAVLCKARVPLGTTHVRMRAASGSGEPVPGPAGTFDLVTLRFDEVTSVTASPPPSVPGAATSRKADLASISGLFGGKSRKEDTAVRPEFWPEKIGENGKSVGPPGPISGRPAIRLEAVQGSGAEQRCRLRFDDGGLLRRVHVVAHGESRSVSGVQRPTQSSPGVAELRNTDGVDELIFFAEDRFGTIVPNLSGRLLVGAREFRDYVPDVSVWYPAFRFRDEFDPGKLPCLACGARGGGTRLVPVMELTPEVRRRVQEKFQPEPGCPPICDRCLARVEADLSWTKNPSMLFQPSSMAFLLAKLVSAMSGSLFPLTAQGLWLRDFLVPSPDAAFERLVANVALSTAGCLFLLALPFNVFLRPVLVLAGVPRLASSSPPPLLMGISGLFTALLAYGLVGPKPGLQAPDGQFLLRITPLLVIACGFAAAAGGLAFERLEKLGRWGLDESASPQERMGVLNRSSQQLLAVRNIAELERALKVLAQEGFLSTSFQIFRYDEPSGKFNATVTVGVKGLSSAGTSIAPTESTLVSAALEHGLPQTWHRLEQTGRGRSRSQDPFRDAQLVIPLSLEGHPLMLVALFELEGSAALGELETVTEGLQVVIGEAIRRTIASRETRS